MDNNEITPAHIRMAAMNLLSMREHSRKELQTKLSRKFEQCEWIESSIEKLKKDNLQSDERFTEAYINMRIKQGKGALIIRVELQDRGVDDQLINEALNSIFDWNPIALKAYLKKFGGKPIVDIKDKAKRIRFLTARGFSSATITHVLSHADKIDWDDVST